MGIFNHHLEGNSLVMRKAFVKGIPTAISYEVVRIESGGYGAVYELLDAASLSKLLASGEITVDEAAKMSVDLLKIVHSKTVSPGDFPDIKKRCGAGRNISGIIFLRCSTGKSAA